MAEYITRIIDTVLDRDLEAFPGVLLVGPRGVGKTATATRRARSALRLDNQDDRSLAHADPDGVIAGLKPPLLIDEWQLAPEILRSVKRAVDQGHGPGRFIVTGSARNDLLADMWPTTGRLIRLNMRGFTARERFGDPTRSSLFDRWDDPAARFAEGPSVLGLRDYLEIALASGLPEAVAVPSENQRYRWLRSYVDEIAHSDLQQFDAPTGRRKDPVLFARYARAYALHTAGVSPDTSILEDAGVARNAGNGYHQALVSMGVITDVPAWASNRHKRLVASPKRYIADAGLAAAMMGATVDDVYAESDLRGRVIDTFLMSQMQVEAEASERPVTISHLRDRNGVHEIDLIAEVGRQLYAFEFKAGSAPTTGDARHLIWFRDEVARDRFGGGVVFHTGPHRHPLHEGIEAVPIENLWRS